MNDHPQICLIHPPGLPRLGFPLGLGTIAALLRNAGFSVAVIDASAGRLTTEQIIAILDRDRPQVIGLTGLTQSAAFNRDLSLRARALFPETIQIGGGPWVSAAPETVLRHTALNGAFIGEVDERIVPAVRRLLAGESSGIGGMACLDANGIFHPPSPVAVPQNLDDLPLPAYDLFPMDYYLPQVPAHRWYYLHRRLPLLTPSERRKRLRLAVISSGRGCYGRCGFCAAASISRRNFSPRYVADHMQLLMTRYGANAFVFSESLTFSNKQWVEAFCHELIARNLGIYYVAMSRGDFAYDPRTIELLFQSGCVAVDVGFESGNRELLDRIGKSSDPEQYTRLIRDFTSAPILVYGQFVVNMPGESARSLADTVTFVRENGIPFSFGAAHPYPGSDLFVYASSKGFCTIEEMVFSNDNKGKTSAAHLRVYLQRFNFNGFSSTEFRKWWDRLEEVRLRNDILIRRGQGVLLGDRIPGFWRALRILRTAVNEVAEAFRWGVHTITACGLSGTARRIIARANLFPRLRAKDMRRFCP